MYRSLFCSQDVPRPCAFFDDPNLNEPKDSDDLRISQDRFSSKVCSENDKWIVWFLRNVGAAFEKHGRLLVDPQQQAVGVNRENFGSGHVTCVEDQHISCLGHDAEQTFGILWTSYFLRV